MIHIVANQEDQPVDQFVPQHHRPPVEIAYQIHQIMTHFVVNMEDLLVDLSVQQQPLDHLHVHAKNHLIAIQD
jgi:hypothetical protein